MQTIIYRIPVGDDNYYGHTTKTLNLRKNWHKKDFRRSPDRKLYKAMRDYGMTEFDIELIWVEDLSCENIYHARARERYWVERDGKLNNNIPNRSNKEYKREKVVCDICSKQMTKGCLSRHKNNFCKKTL